MIKLIVAHDPNFLIGKNGGLPWDIKEDLLHFKNETLNKTVLMGYTTFKSLDYKPLKNRKNIVITENTNQQQIENVEYRNDLINVLNEHKNKNELYVIGGASIYKQCLPHVDELVISYVYKEYSGDAYLTNYLNDFELYKVEPHNEFEVRRYKRK